MKNKRWQQRPPGSNWGEFGPDDQRGRMNYVTREKVLQGVAEVKEGLTFVLSLPLDYPGGNGLNPRRHPPRIAATQRNGRQNFAYEVRQDNPMQTDVVCDDLVLLTLQYSTQWDSFAHVGGMFDADGDGKPEAVFYNGFRAGVDVIPAKENSNAEAWAKFEGSRAEALGIQNLAEHGAQGRGVMIDLHAHFGRKRHAVGYDDLQRILEQDKVDIERGDIVCLHTGFAELLLELKKNPTPELLHNTCTGLDGKDEKLLQWVS
ncbi:MAG: cyclase family protein, partial [Burkholderiales bacterium]